MNVVDTKIHSILKEVGDKYPADSSDIRWALQEIKKVYSDLNYGTIQKDKYRDDEGKAFQQYVISYADGSGEFVRVPVDPSLSGQEWYDKFLEEYDSNDQPQIKDSLIVREQVFAAAKKAAGIL